MESRPFTMAFEADPGLLEVRGAIDDTDVLELRMAIEFHVASSARHLIIDLTEAERLPGEALEALADAQRAAEDTWPKVHLRARYGSIAHRVLQLHGLPHWIL